MEAPVPKITYEDLKDVLRKYIAIFFLWQDPIPQDPKKNFGLKSRLGLFTCKFEICFFALHWQKYFPKTLWC